MLLGKVLDQVVIKTHQFPTPHKIAGRVIGGDDSQHPFLTNLGPVTLFLAVHGGNDPLAGNVLVDLIQQFTAIRAHSPGDATFAVGHWPRYSLPVLFKQRIEHIAVDDTRRQLTIGHAVDQCLIRNIAFQHFQADVVVALGQFGGGFLIGGPFRYRQRHLPHLR